MDRAQHWQTIRAIVLGIAAVGGVLGVMWFLDSGSNKTPPVKFPSTGGTYNQTRQQLLAIGLKPAPIPRGGEFDQCGVSGEGALCKQFPELVNCVGMGPTSGTCRMAFVAQNDRFVVVSACCWDDPNTMILTGIAWATKEDAKRISNIISGKEEYDFPETKSNAPTPSNPSVVQKEPPDQAASEIPDPDPNANQGYGSSDPYAKDYRNKITNDYVDARETFLKEVDAVYFACGCKVVNNPNFIEDALGQPLSALADANNIIDTHVAWEITKAENAGLARAKQPNACEYFHQHPDLVYQLRQEELVDTLAWSTAHGH